MAEQVVDKLIINIDVTGNARSEIGNINKSLKNMGNEGKENINNKMSSSLSMFTSKLIILGYALKKTVNMFSGFVNESTAYTENLNLFRVTFGNLANEAERFTNTFANALGLDVSQVMRNMGFFNQIATGFGLVQDKAFEMSKTLTQISYDISSFFDISVEESIAKVQSGLAGELEPLRRIGYALDQATLQQLAYNLGVQKSIREMTQAEKAQLRTIAIYQQSTNIMGDLAETIESPANQLRILKQQFTLLARSIGNMIIPILTKILPVINGVVQGLTAVFNQVAKIFGFQLGEGARETAGYFDGVAGSINNVEKSAKKMLLPFDNFLSLSRDLGEGAISGGLDLATPTYDALALMNKIATKANEIANSIKGWFLDIDENGNIIGLNQTLQDIVFIGKTMLDIFQQIFEKLDVGMFMSNLAYLASKLVSIIKSLLEIKWIFDALIISIEIGLTMVTGGIYAIIKYWEQIPAFFTGIFEDIFGGITTILRDFMNFIIRFINIILTPFNYLGNIFGLNNAIQIPEISGFATGGFTPEVTGSLFQAGEGGKPELMGSVRGKNAVANVQSIEGAMENAAYRGMTRALSSIGTAQGSQKDIILNIDGKELTRATVKNMASELSKNYRVNFATR